MTYINEWESFELSQSPFQKSIISFDYQSNRTLALGCYNSANRQPIMLKIHVRIAVVIDNLHQVYQEKNNMKCAL